MQKEKNKREWGIEINSLNATGKRLTSTQKGTIPTETPLVVSGHDQIQAHTPPLRSKNGMETFSLI